MSSYNHICDSDHRNEGWGLNGSGVSEAWQAWNNDDDTKYCSSPAHKGRCAVKFPLDISSSNIPNGAKIESITLIVRAKINAGAGDRSLTVNLLSRDDTSKFTSRTVRPTTTISNIEVGTYTTDPLGRPWTKHTLNKIIAQVFSYCSISDAIRVYKFFVQINYKGKPTVVVTAPSGTVTTPSPTLTWTYSQVDGDIQKSAEYKIFTAVAVGGATFSPDTTPSLFPVSTTHRVRSGDTLWGIAKKHLGDGSLWPQCYNASNLRSGDPDRIYPGEIVTIPGVANVTGDITSLILPFALTPNDYYVYVRATSVKGARSDWAGKAFTVQGAAPGVPGGGVGFGGVGAGGGGGFVNVIADSESSNAYLTLRDGSNLMSNQQSNFETTGDSLGYTATNCVLAQDTTTYFNMGAGSMSLTASSAATMSALSTFEEVAPSTPITARAQFKTAVTARTVNIRILFYDVNFTAIGAGTISGTGTDATDTWTEISCTGTTPVDAVYAKVQLEVASPANAEKHMVDAIGLMYGTDSAWSHGGHASRNLLSSAASDADDPITTEPWAAVSAATTYTRVANSGTGADGTKTFKMTYAGISPTISVVSTSSAYSDVATSAVYTLNKPSSVANGDLLVAYVATDASVIATPPTGWTRVNSQISGSGSTASSITVLVRDGLAADPSTWAGTFPANRTRCRAVVVAYRGAAAVAEQFLAENVAGTTSGTTTPATATVNNTDAGAWRLSAFAVRDNATGGAMVANTVAPSAIPAIQFVAAATEWKSGSSASSYTINRPAGVADGDLMIAFVNVVATFGGSGINTPSGWTLVDSITQTDSTSPLTTKVFKRQAGASEPASWAGTLSSSAQPVITQCVAYRNAEIASNQFIDTDTSTSGSGSSITTDTVTNTNSNAWRISAFMYSSSSSATSTSNEVSERCDDSIEASSGSGDDEAGTIAVYDSNGPVSTGSHSRTGSLSQSYRAAVSWIGIIKPLSAAPSPPGNETERADATTGSSDPWLTLGVYDSNGVAAIGSKSVTAQFTPGSGSGTVSASTWIGLLKPTAPTVGGEASVVLVDYIDISDVSKEVIDRSAGQVTFQASLLGSVAGTPYLKVSFYNANELISTQIAEGTSFNDTTWVKSSATFGLPSGCTRMKATIIASDRAVSDITYFDRVSLAFGSSTVWRRGTGRAEHPIFNVPLVEYAEDLGTGYGEWSLLPATSNQLLKYDQLTGLTTLIDQTLSPLSSRKYRARTISYGLEGDTFISDYGPESDEISLEATNWWLKDPRDPEAALPLKVVADPLAVKTASSSAVFQPLGEDLPLVLTEGYKGDSVEITVICTRTEYQSLKLLLSAGTTLVLQSNLDNAWWVRPISDLDVTTKVTSQRNTNPLRWIKLGFVQVEAEL